MITIGKKLGLDKIGLTDVDKIFRNLPVESLIKDILLHKEGKMGMNGAIMVDTGRYTGRSPKDKYFVDEKSSNENLWWGPVNVKLDESIFDELYEQVVNYYNHADDSKTYIFDGFAGADPTYRLNCKNSCQESLAGSFCTQYVYSS
jgi:phosphoenolpyruvate carboxykinase (ATP)